MTATPNTEILSDLLSFEEWSDLDRETQIDIAEYDDGEFRVLYTFTTHEMRRDENNRWRAAMVTWSVCEELLAGRWEPFVSTGAVVWK